LTHSRLAPHAAFAADLVRRRVDVIVATGELPLRAAASATSTIPVVFTIGSDPVQSRLVASLARPDGNITGFTAIATELVSKRFELLSELLPLEKRTSRSKGGRSGCDDRNGHHGVEARPGPRPCGRIRDGEYRTVT